MTAIIDIRDEDAAIVRDILRRYLPTNSRVFIFGSRVRGSACLYSDLDLAIDCGKPLGLDLAGEIAEAFSESDLPYTVDIVDLTKVDPDFQRRICDAAVPLLL